MSQVSAPGADIRETDDQLEGLRDWLGIFLRQHSWRSLFLLVFQSSQELWTGIDYGLGALGALRRSRIPHFERKERIRPMISFPLDNLAHPSLLTAQSDPSNIHRTCAS